MFIDATSLSNPSVARTAGLFSPRPTPPLSWAKSVPPALCNRALRRIPSFITLAFLFPSPLSDDPPHPRSPFSCVLPSYESGCETRMEKKGPAYLKEKKSLFTRREWPQRRRKRMGSVMFPLPLGAVRCRPDFRQFRARMHLSHWQRNHLHSNAKESAIPRSPARTPHQCQSGSKRCSS